MFFASVCVCVCVLLGEASGGAKGIASRRPVTCKVELNPWRMSPISLGWQLFTEKTPVWLRYCFFFLFFVFFHPFFLSLPFKRNKKKNRLLPTDVQTFSLPALTKSFVWTGMSTRRIKLPVPFFFAAVGVWPYNGPTNSRWSRKISVPLLDPR